MFLVDVDMPLGELGRKEIRSCFDTNEELIEFCISNYDSIKRKNNLIFDLRAELSFLESYNSDSQVETLKIKVQEQAKKIVRLDSRLARWERVINTDYSSIEYHGKISIYGCGAIGRTLYNYMKYYFDIIEFIDKTPRQNMYGQIPVNSILHSISDKDTLIIIVPSYDFDKIKSDLVESFTYEPNVIRIEEFLAKGTVVDSFF